MKQFLVLLVAGIFFISCDKKQKEGATLVTPAVFETATTDTDGQSIDVRTPKEYNSGHIKGAVNMHIYDQNFEQRLDTLDKNKTVYVYCKSGGRSAEAVEALKAKNFKYIVELDGGIEAWQEAGKPVE